MISAMANTRAKIGPQGRITVPKEVRQRLKLHAGDGVDFYYDKTGRVFVRVVHATDVSSKPNRR